MYDLEDVLMKSFREDNGISSAFSIEPVDDNEYRVSTNVVDGLNYTIHFYLVVYPNGTYALNDRVLSLISTLDLCVVFLLSYSSLVCVCSWKATVPSAERRMSSGKTLTNSRTPTRGSSGWRSSSK